MSCGTVSPSFVSHISVFNERDYGEIRAGAQSSEYDKHVPKKLFIPMSLVRRLAHSWLSTDTSENVTCIRAEYSEWHNDHEDLRRRLDAIVATMDTP